MTYKLLLASASFLVLTACASMDSDSNGAAGGANAGRNSNNVATSGMGSGRNFAGSKAMQVGNQIYYFDFDSSDVHPDNLPSIKVQANYLNAHSNAKVMLAGNTDERGSREYNIGLGERRAQSVAAALQSNGVAKEQIATVSYGAEKPLAVGHTDSDYAENRRVELSYQPPISN